MAAATFEDGFPCIDPIEQPTNSLDTGGVEVQFPSGSSCPICLDEYREGDEICRSLNVECGHVYHHHCITEWILRGEHAECPMCRTDFLTPNNILALLDDNHGDDSGFTQDDDSDSFSGENILGV
jgi:hypothetical protein